MLEAKGATKEEGHREQAVAGDGQRKEVVHTLTEQDSEKAKQIAGANTL